MKETQRENLMKKDNVVQFKPKVKSPDTVTVTLENWPPVTYTLTGDNINFSYSSDMVNITTAGFGVEPVNFTDGFNFPDNIWTDTLTVKDEE